METIITLSGDVHYFGEKLPPSGRSDHMRPREERAVRWPREQVMAARSQCRRLRQDEPGPRWPSVLFASVEKRGR